MTKEEIAKFLEEHKPTDPEQAKAFENNLPHIVETLEYFAGEGVVSQLNDGDKFQFLTRYLNDFGVLLRNILHFELRIEKLLTFIAEGNGIDVKKAFKDDAAKQAELLDKRIEESKEQLQNFKKN